MIRADTLPALVPASELYSARIVKIDVEGAERLVIAGISGVLATFAEDTEWIVELSPEFSPGGHDDTNWIFEQFRSHGYRAYRLPNDYSIGPLLDPPRFIVPVRLDNAPTDRLVDVLFTKPSAAGIEPAAKVSRSVMPVPPRSARMAAAAFLAPAECLDEGRERPLVPNPGQRGRQR